MRIRILAAAAPLVLALPLVAASSPEPVMAEDVRHIANVPGIGGHVNVEGDTLVAGSFGLGMRIFDISNREKPVQVGQYYPTGSGPANVAGRADAVPDIAVFDGRTIASLGGNRSGFGNRTEFLDITDPATPKLLWTFTGDDGNAHTGDIIDERRLWMPAGGGTFRLYDLNPVLATPPAKPDKVFSGDLVSMWGDSPHRNGRPKGPGLTHLHEATHHLDVPVQVGVDENGAPIIEPRDLALVAEGGNYTGNGNTGSLFVVDITDPTAPVVLNRYLHQNETSGTHHPIRYYHEARLLDGDPSVIIVSDEDMHSGCEAGGMTILKANASYTAAVEVSEWFNGTGTPAAVCSVHNFTTHGNLMYIGSYSAGLQVVDVSNPAAPKRVGQYIAPGADTWGAHYYDGYVYTGDLGARGLDVFEFMGGAVAQGAIISNPVITNRSGVSETLCENGRGNGDPSIDAVVAEIPVAHRDGKAKVRGTGSGTHEYDLNAYFYDANCTFMSGVSLNADGRDVVGPIPEQARYVVVANVGMNALSPEPPPHPAARRPALPTYVYVHTMS